MNKAGFKQNHKPRLAGHKASHLSKLAGHKAIYKNINNSGSNIVKSSEVVPLHPNDIFSLFPVGFARRR